MKDLAIIGASYLQLPLIEKAKEMGLRTHVFAWKADDVGDTAADYFYPISITCIDEITERCREIGICGICSIATDLGNYTVNYVANRLGLTCNSMESTLNSTNKYLMRKAFYDNGDPSPRYRVLNHESDIENLDMSYPVIVKPTDRSGSRGVLMVEAEAKLGEAVRRALHESFEGKAVIEEYVKGKEYSVEGISYKGNHSILAVTEKFTTGAPNFIETGHREPVILDEATRRRIEDVVIHALNTLQIENGASHSEIKIDDEGVIKIIEIGSRMGGDCIGSDLVWCSTGIDYLKAVIQIACGEEPDLNKVHETCNAEVRFILSEEDLSEFRRLQREEADRIIRVADDRHFGLIGKTTSSSDRAGCYIVSF